MVLTDLAWCVLVLLANVGLDSKIKWAVASSLFDAGRNCVCALTKFIPIIWNCKCTLSCPSSGRVNIECVYHVVAYGLYIDYRCYPILATGVTNAPKFRRGTFALVKNTSGLALTC